MKRLLPLLTLAVCALAGMANAQNAAPLAPPSLQFLDNNGVPLAGGYLRTCTAGSACSALHPWSAPATPLATYTDSSAATPNANPIVLDSAGRANVWLGASAYKLVLTDANGVVIWTQDNVRTAIPGTTTFASASIAGNATIGGNLTVSGTISGKLRDVVSVKDYGAKGDGATDDTTAITNALTYVSGITPHPALYFPHGTYIVSGTLTLSATGLQLYGDGIGQTSIKWASTASTAIPMFDHSASAGGLRISDMTLDGNSNKAQVLVLSGGGVANIFNDTYQRVDFRAPGRYAVDGYGGNSGYGINDQTFIDCYFDFAGIAALKLRFPFTRIYGGNINSNATAGIQLMGNGGVYADGTIFTTNGVDVEYSGDSSQLIASGVWFENSTNGIIKVDSGVKLSRFIVSHAHNLHTLSTTNLIDTTGAGTGSGASFEISVTDSYCASSSSFAVKIVPGVSLVWAHNKGTSPTITNTGGVIRYVEEIGSDAYAHVNVGSIDQTDNTLNVITNNAALAGNKLALFRSEQGDGYVTVQVDQSSHLAAVKFPVAGANKGYMGKDWQGDDMVFYNCTGSAGSETCAVSLRAKNGTGNVIVGTSTTDSGDKLQVGGALNVSGAVKLPSIKSLTGTRFLCVDSAGNVSASATACSGT